MKDGVQTGEQVAVSRRDVYEHYVKCHLQSCTDVGPCRDAPLLMNAAQYLLREPEPTGAFTVFPFYRVLAGGSAPPNTDCRRLLTAVAKAVELLETICVNLFLQPWKKEFKTLKTFTGPFVYFLLPVFGRSTIQSVLASIGYLPHPDDPSEFRLSEDANLDQVLLVGFELLLARVECHRLRELLDRDQLGPQEWLEVLHRRAGSIEQKEPTEKKTSPGQREEEQEEKMKEEANRKEGEVSLQVEPLSRRRQHTHSVCQSIIEMKMKYDDLAFRGRPLVPVKPQLVKPRRAHCSRSSNKAVHTAGDESRAAAAAAAALPVRSKAGDGVDGGCNDGDGGGTSSPGNSSWAAGESRAEDERQLQLQAMSLHLTLKAVGTQQPLTADLQNKRPASPEVPSLSSVEEEQQLRELAEKMGQLHVHESREESKRKLREDKSGDKSAHKEWRKQERKASAAREDEEQSGESPVSETGPWLV